MCQPVTDAECRELIAYIESSELPESRINLIAALACDYLALKAAVRLVHGEPQHGGMFMAICKAKEIIETVVKEQEPPHAE